MIIRGCYYCISRRRLIIAILHAIFSEREACFIIFMIICSPSIIRSNRYCLRIAFSCSRLSFMSQNHSIRLGSDLFCCGNGKFHSHILFSFVGSELDSHCACAITGSRRYCISRIIRRNRPLHIALYIERSRSITSLCCESGSAYRELRTGVSTFSTSVATI